MSISRAKRLKDIQSDRKLPRYLQCSVFPPPSTLARRIVITELQTVPRCGTFWMEGVCWVEYRTAYVLSGYFVMLFDKRAAFGWQERLCRTARRVSCAVCKSQLRQLLVLIMLVGQVERSTSVLVGLLYVIESGREGALLKYSVQVWWSLGIFALTVTKSLS